MSKHEDWETGVCITVKAGEYIEKGDFLEIDGVTVGRAVQPTNEGDVLAMDVGPLMRETVTVKNNHKQL